MASSRPSLLSSIRNPRIAALRSLSQRRHRSLRRCFKVEGLQALEMALAAGVVPHEVFFPVPLVASRARRALDGLLAAGAAPIAVSPELMQKLSDRGKSDAVIATWPFVDRPLDGLPLSDRDLVVVADGLGKSSNVGMLIRSADAVGAAAVILVGPHADPFDPTALRASMGSVFNVPVVCRASAAAVVHRLRSVGLPILAADAHRGEALGSACGAPGIALALGNEVRGVGPELRAAAERCVRLPMRGRADSLNVAVAGSVLMYLWLETR